MEFKEKSKPIYLQIVDSLADRVANGTYAEGARIPSVREFAAQVQVNPNTVMRAYDHLSRLGVVFNRRGIGYFIAEGARRIITEIRSREFFEDEILRFFEQLALLGVDPGQLARLYEDYLNERKSSSSTDNNENIDISDDGRSRDRAAVEHRGGGFGHLSRDLFK